MRWTVWCQAQKKERGEKRRLQNSHTKKHDKPFYKKSTYKKIKTLKSPKICNKQDHWPQSWSTYMLMIAVRKCSKNKCPTFLSFQMTINFFKIYQQVILSASITVHTIFIWITKYKKIYHLQTIHKNIE